MAAHAGRNYDYRTEYFKNHKGLFGMRIYFCAYCGKPMKLYDLNKAKNERQREQWRSKNQKIHVDHIIPKHGGIRGLDKEGLASGALQYAFNRSINNVVACSKCNISKSDKIDYRVLQGYAAKFGGAAVGTAVGGTYKMAKGTVKVGTKATYGVAKYSLKGVTLFIKHSLNALWWTFGSSLKVIFNVIGGILRSIFKTIIANPIVIGVIAVIVYFKIFKG